jgi:hypothetical protein
MLPFFLLKSQDTLSLWITIPGLIIAGLFVFINFIYVYSWVKRRWHFLQGGDTETTKRNKGFENNHLSRIKDIYLELPGYLFFHSPSAVHKPDRRFLGRERLLHKLKAILNDTQTPSGAYLITGFRGVGKTSLIRKVISDTQGASPVVRKLLAYSLSLLALFFLLSFIDWHDLLHEGEFELLGLGPLWLVAMVFVASVVFL